MSREKLIGYGGPAAMVGGVLYLAIFAATVLVNNVFAEEVKGTIFGLHATIHVLDVATFALLMIGAVAVYLRQSDRLGKAGKAGFFLTSMGFGLSVAGGLAIIAAGIAVGDEATYGILDVLAHPLAMLLYVVGSLFFGIATFRARVLPRGAALLVALGPLVLFAMMTSGLVGPNGSVVLPMVPWAATAFGWVWLGRALLSERRAEPHNEQGGPAAQPRPAVR